MENELKVFKNEELGLNVRCTIINGKEYFCASDIAKALGYVRPNDAISQHCRATVKHSTRIGGKIQDINFIPEGDMYRLIIKSKLPSAEKFESWVMEEVLPSIRKTGGYIPVNDEDDELTIMAKAFEIQQKTIAKKDELLALKTKQLEQVKPKLEEYDVFMDSKDAKSMSIVSKEIGMLGRNTLFKYLRRKKILMSKCERKNVPYQSFLDRGLFIVKEKVNADGESRPQTFVTPNGISFIVKQLKKDGYFEEFSVDELIYRLNKIS